MTTLDRIKILCKEKKMNITSLEKKCGFSQNSIVKWAKTSPSVDKIICVARYFNVSADYLLCLTDEPKPLESRELKQIDYSVPAIVGEMPDLFREQRFVNTAKVYNELPDEYRERMYEYIVTVAVNLGINVAKVIGSSRL